MDNAAKAVVIAGSVLVAIGVISIALYFYGVFSCYFRQSEQLYSNTQIDNFNRFYQSYETSSGSLTAIDALNIYNRAKDDGIPTSKISIPNVATIKPDNYLTRKYYHYKLTYDPLGMVNGISCTTAP